MNPGANAAIGSCCAFSNAGAMFGARVRERISSELKAYFFRYGFENENDSWNASLFCAGYFHGSKIGRC